MTNTSRVREPEIHAGQLTNMYCMIPAFKGECECFFQVEPVDIKIDMENEPSGSGTGRFIGFYRISTVSTFKMLSPSLVPVTFAITSVLGGWLGSLARSARFLNASTALVLPVPSST